MSVPGTGAIKVTAPRLRGQLQVTWTGVATASALIAVSAAAAGLRFWGLSSVRLNPYYDAAVRSMTLSWHNFFYGAFEPGGALAVDKTPVDLWLQVVSVKLLAFSSFALHLPEALGSAAAVPLLYHAVRRLFGRGAGLAAAAALAVLPISVITGRSDTMDSVMMALVVLAAWLVVRAAQSGRILPLLGAGATMGLAFNVKLFEALVPLPALALLFWMASAGPARARLGRLAAGGAAFVVVALSWLTAATLGPGHHPYPVGSTDGSVWNVTFVFNGIDRLRNPGAPVTVNPPTATRLFDGPYASLIGTTLLAALVLGGVAVLVAVLAARHDGSPPRSARAGAVAFAMWLVGGAALFTVMQRLHPRYLEAITPAIAAAIGIGIASLAVAASRRRTAAGALVAATATAGLGSLALGPSAPARTAVIVVAAALAGLVLACLAIRRRGTAALATLAALAVVAVLAVPATDVLTAVSARTSSAGEPGAMPSGEVGALSRYLTTHARHTRYEVASSSVALAGPVIVRDARPVLMLTTMNGRAFTTAGTLRAAVRRGEVRYALLSRATCPGGRCAPAVRWALAHATDVGPQAGLHRRGLLYRLSDRARR